MTMAGTADKYLGFTLAGEDYLVPILDVVEIVSLLPITPVPGAAAHLLGVVNLRDRVVPVVDVGARLGLVTPTAGEPECLVIVYGHDGAEVGVLVDRVAEVVDVAQDSIAPATDLGSHAPGAHLVGIARNDGGVRFVLDVASAIGPVDTDLVRPGVG